MAELLRVKCTGGLLIVTEREVIIQLEKPKWLGGGLIKQDTLARSLITGTHTKVHSMNGFVDFTFTGAGKELAAKLVKPADAERVLAVLAEPA